MDKVISVIIPVYNVEAYLPECLDSVLAQDYPALEILLIDDGSRDASPQICDAYAAKDSRIRVIHQANAGAGAAKNTGLRAAAGTYLAFLDSDDTLEPGAYSHMAALMEEYDTDVVQCLLRYVYKDRQETVMITPGRQLFQTEEYLRRYPTADWTCALMTEKLFKRELFQGIFFEEGNVIDDEYFTYRGIMNARSILRDDRVIYNYRQRYSSVMNSPEKKERILLNELDYLNKRRKNIARQFPRLKQYFNEAYLEALVAAAGKPHNTPRTLRRIRGDITRYFREPDWDRPGLRFLPRLLYVRFAPLRMLLKHKAAEAQQINPESLYP